MNDRERVIDRMYAAFNARDIETVLAALHADVDWPNGWEGGRILGRDGVRDYWTRQWAAIDPASTRWAIGPNRTGGLRCRSTSASATATASCSSTVPCGTSIAFRTGWSPPWRSRKPESEGR